MWSISCACAIRWWGLASICWARCRIAWDNNRITSAVDWHWVTRISRRRHYFTGHIVRHYTCISHSLSHIHHGISHGSRHIHQLCVSECSCSEYVNHANIFFCFAGRLCDDVEVFSEDAAVNVVVGAFDDELTLSLVFESSQSGLCRLG